tara:strand:- start:72 stop:602 length:531 start_codon:yes stop_codon:yes gene_type:complete
MKPNTGIAIVHSLFNTLMQDGNHIAQFIVDNVGHTLTTEEMAPASWRDLDDIFNYDDTGNNSFSSQQGGGNTAKPRNTINLKLACEKLQLALMQLSSEGTKSSEDENGKDGQKKDEVNAEMKMKEYVQLAESAAHDFCSGMRSEIEHLVDNIMEREPFVKQLEQMLAKELGKNYIF